MKLIVAAIVGLAAGVLLGCIPFVNRHLHWNLYVVIPISGVILGVAFGGVQAVVARALHARVGGLGCLFLALVGALAYAATDVGVWATTKVELDNGQSVALREVASLPEYMSERLSHSSISTRGKSIQMGSAVTIISFVVDELGAFVGAALVVFAYLYGEAYCRRCSRYRKAVSEDLRGYPFDDAESEARWTDIRDLAMNGQYSTAVARFRALPAAQGDVFRIVKAKESVCPKCGRPALALSLQRRDEKGEYVSDGRSLSFEAVLDDKPQLVG